MGRRKKDYNGSPTEETEQLEGDELDMDEKVEIPELKSCPVCGAFAAVKKDIHGLYRCACVKCGFWDSVPHYNQLDAAESWNAAGGPNPIE